MSQDTQGSQTPTEKNHIDTVRAHLIDQLQALREAPVGSQLDAEISRAKALSDVAQTIVNSAKVEVEYLQKTGQTSAPFLEAPPDEPYRGATGKPELPNGITSITRHRLK